VPSPPAAVRLAVNQPPIRINLENWKMERNTILPDDPRLTAYALGEMTPEESAEFEKQLRGDEAARRTVAEIREMSVSLTSALADEAMPAIEAHDFAKAAGAAGNDSRRRDDGVTPPDGVLGKRIKFPQFYYVVSGLAAACFALFFVYWQENQPVHARKKYIEVPLVAANSANEPKVASVALPADQPPGEPEVRQPALLKAQSRMINERRQEESAGDVKFANDAAPQARGHAQVAEERSDRTPSPAAIQADGLLVAAESQQRKKDEAISRGYYMAGGSLAGSRIRTRLSGAGSAAPMVFGGTDPLTYSTRSIGRAADAEDYAFRKDSGYIRVADEPLSTFSVDVDTASYANMRRFLTQGRRPPIDAVRIEEMVNYFPYDYAGPQPLDSRGEVSGPPFAAHLEVAGAPWAPGHRLVRIGLKGREVSDAARPAANLVFLLDVSGSMNAANKLPLVKQSLRMLVGKLRSDDRVAIAVYAGASGLALPSTPVSHKAEILEAIDRLEANGSTNGAMGIHLAYDIAKANFVAGGVNRVILATDGDFNVGVTSQGDLIRLVQEKARSGVFLSVLGFGMGNLKDGTLEQLADKGNGNYAYIDSSAEARKTLVEQAGGTLVTIARDVKLQVEFNPAVVQAYRLIGYENRLLAREDFNNDKIDAGEIGAGHTVTALYEVVPVGVELETAPGVDPLKYQRTETSKPMIRNSKSAEMLTVRIRYKEPAGDVSNKLEFPLFDAGTRFENATQDFKFASAVAAFGMVLRDSPYKGSTTLTDIAAWGRAGLDRDSGGYRSEFIGLVERSEALLQ